MSATPLSPDLSPMDDDASEAARDAATRAARDAEADAFDAIEAEVHALRERCLRRLSIAGGVAAALLLVGVAWWSRHAS